MKLTIFFYTDTPTAIVCSFKAYQYFGGELFGRIPLIPSPYCLEDVAVGVNEDEIYAQELRFNRRTS